MENKKTYIGDSVYVSFDGFMFCLTTENGAGMPSNVIYLEPQVLEQLNEFAKRTYATNGGDT